MVWFVLLNTSAIVPTHLSAHQCNSGRGSIILTRLTPWLRWWVVSSMFGLNSFKLNGNSIVIASRLWIRNLKSQPTPPAQLCLSPGEKSPWHQCPDSTLPLHTQLVLQKHRDDRSKTCDTPPCVFSAELATKFRWQSLHWQWKHKKLKFCQPAFRSYTSSAAITKKISICLQER